MSTLHPFRFGATATSLPSRTAWIEQARKAEALGYSTLIMGDHLSWGGVSTIPGLMAAADATSSIRLACHTINNDLRNPVVLASDMATLDLLSDGRLEFGLGAGWLSSDYTATGIRFDSGALRVRRLAEAIRLIKRLWSEDRVTHAGEFYQTCEVGIHPKPLQQPSPPILIGGGGQGILSLAAREANIVGIDLKGTTSGGKDMVGSDDVVLARQIDWICEAAGDRMPSIELHMLSFTAVVAESRQAAAEQLNAEFSTWPAEIIANVPNTEQILASRQSLIGSVDTIVETLLELRERYGISYISYGGSAIERFSPIVARLAGK